MKRNVLALQSTYDRLDQWVGYSTKQRHICIGASMAALILKDLEFAIDVQLDSPEMKEEGFGTIYKYLMWKYPLDSNRCRIVRPTKSQRYDSAKRHHNWLRSGFESLEDGLDADHHEPIFIVPRSSQKTRIEVITLYGNYQVNPDETARQIKELVDFRFVKNAAESFGHKVELLHGSRNGLIDQIAKEAERIAQLTLPPPRMQLPE